MMRPGRLAWSVAVVGLVGVWGGTASRAQAQAVRAACGLREGCDRKDSAAQRARERAQAAIERAHAAMERAQREADDRWARDQEMKLRAEYRNDMRERQRRAQLQQSQRSKQLQASRAQARPQSERLQLQQELARSQREVQKEIERRQQEVMDQLRDLERDWQRDWGRDFDRTSAIRAPLRVDSREYIAPPPGVRFRTRPPGVT